ncbi:MAG: acylphosphatase [Casimicrobiaceae bacterium]|nr:acylphosphatase [Casimicrobiaceae bacterium]MDW8312947.1 acylphosphatase [Burkholderiales bacterium]
MSSAAQCKQLRIYGRVQGVGYRAAFAAEAERLGISGWVRNRRDGSVEALVAGPPEAVEAIERFAWNGPPLARVERVEVHESDESVGAGFVIRPTV